MQHVAEEAGMSAGNLYRYFPSKEAIVEGLVRSSTRPSAPQTFAELLADDRHIMRRVCETCASMCSRSRRKRRG